MWGKTYFNPCVSKCINEPVLPHTFRNVKLRQYQPSDSCRQAAWGCRWWPATGDITDDQLQLLATGYRWKEKNERLRNPSPLTPLFYFRMSASTKIEALFFLSSVCWFEVRIEVSNGLSRAKTKKNLLRKFWKSPMPTLLCSWKWKDLFWWL